MVLKLPVEVETTLRASLAPPLGFSRVVLATEDAPTSARLVATLPTVRPATFVEVLVRFAADARQASSPSLVHRACALPVISPVDSSAGTLREDRVPAVGVGLSGGA